MCQREVMWQIKNPISPLSQYFGHKTYQGGDIMQEASTHKFEWPLNVRSNTLYHNMQKTHEHQTR